RLTGNGAAPVLADNGPATGVVIGSTYLTSAGGFQSAVRFDSAAANTYTRNTLVSRGFTADVQVGGAQTPFGFNATTPSTVSAGGNLIFSGANGTAANAAGDANNNAFAFVPGSTLQFDNTTAAGAGLTAGRWADAAPVNLYGTALTLKGTATGTTAETVGGITFDGASVITINKNGGTATTLTANS